MVGLKEDLHAVGVEAVFIDAADRLHEGKTREPTLAWRPFAESAAEGCLKRRQKH